MWRAPQWMDGLCAMLLGHGCVRIADDVPDCVSCRMGNHAADRSHEEKSTLDAAIRSYAAEHGLSASSLDWLFHTRSASATHDGRLQRVWYDLAACLPARSPKQVWQHATRRLHEAKGQGRWTQDEADQLAGLVAQHGTRWTDVGAALGRAPEECKDKYVRCVPRWPMWRACAGTHAAVAMSHPRAHVSQQVAHPQARRRPEARRVERGGDCPAEGIGGAFPSGAPASRERQSGACHHGVSHASRELDT